jgi:3-hydroxyisobutyrate dehydrogenase-like beta-hydroxyacid dehydrogenase
MDTAPLGAGTNAIRIALIGFGEVGQIFARGFLASGRHEIATYDILFGDAGATTTSPETARAIGAEPCASAAEAAAGARVVISAVTAVSARDVATAAGGYLKPGQIFLDINSVSPDAKRANAQAVEGSGASYVEAAVMAPVPPHGLKVPILLGGTAAGELAQLLGPAGMKLEIGSAIIGEASAIKMCRSIMIKGLEAITVECFLTARHYGVEDTIVASLDQSYPSIDWEKQAGYLIGRVVAHGRRRAAEMREVGDTVAATGLAPLMATAIADRQDWVADVVAMQPALKDADDSSWRTTLDALSASLHATTGD